ncbi:GtrA family protein [Proteus mirabilis]|uniref:GtrA family protein n=1 Tax=Proteus mirabilis TaxID=584 RepID=UPI003F1B8FE6
MLQLFARYFSVGVINTLLHWVVFGIFVYLVTTTQATANLIAFIIAVTFSFFANAKFTFKKKATGRRYIAFTVFMGVLMAASISNYLNINSISNRSEISKKPVIII